MSGKPLPSEVATALSQFENGMRELVEYLRDSPSTKSPIIAAEKILLVDSQGEVRGQLGVAEDGAASLALIDQNGNYRAWLGVKGDGAAFISLRDEMGRISFAAPESATRSRRPGEAPATAGEARPPATAADQALTARLTQVEEEVVFLKRLLASKGISEIPGPAADETGAADPQPVLRLLDQMEKQFNRLKVAGAVILALLVAALAAVAYMISRT